MNITTTHPNHLIISFFREQLLRWDAQLNDRPLPWRGEKDPYKIWLSEIILQQTRVEQGLPYYHKFISSFPTVQALAGAEEGLVFKHWEGLGYYSRCRNLIATARAIATENNGLFPNSYTGLLALKGIGPYTAAAIASFAFGLPHAVVDGNVFRVLARFFGISTPIDSTPGKKEFTQLANLLLDADNAAAYNQAIMDFGAVICKPAAPRCSGCPLAKKCMALANNEVNNLPVKQKKPVAKARYFFYFNLNYKNKIAIEKREAKDIWQHLYQLPLIELTQSDTPETALHAALERHWLHEADEILSINKSIQKLTHQTIHCTFIAIACTKKPAHIGAALWVDKNNAAAYAFPKSIAEYLKKQAGPV